MSTLPAVNDDHEAMTSHRQRLVRTIDKTAEWRRRKAQEFAESPVSARRSRRAVAALEALAEYVEGLEDDDPELRLTYRALHEPGDPQSTYRLRQGVETLGRYGLGLRDVPTDEDHAKFLRNLAATEIQVKTETDESRAKRLIEMVYKNMRTLRFIQERTSEDTAAMIENRLSEIWDTTFTAEDEEE